MMMIKRTTAFKKQYKLMQKRGCNMSALRTVVALLASGAQLPQRYRDHALDGEWRSYRECHIKPDWLLIYRIEESQLILTLTRTGSHADLFDL